MNWFWLNIPLAAVFLAVWAGIPLWLVFRHPDHAPQPAGLSIPRQGGVSGVAGPQAAPAGHAGPQAAPAGHARPRAGVSG